MSQFLCYFTFQGCGPPRKNKPKQSCYYHYLNESHKLKKYKTLTYSVLQVFYTVTTAELTDFQISHVMLTDVNYNVATRSNVTTRNSPSY